MSLTACYSACRDDEFTCGSGSCLPVAFVCDGKNDCGDYSDERNCGLLFEYQCYPDSFICGDNTCLSGFTRCNAFENCADGSDEESCREFSVSLLTFKCQTDDRCIPLEWRCDNKTDCVDGSDEHCVCTDEEFMCENGLCINEDLFCNGQPNCPLGEDEPEGCACRAGQFKCDNGVCIDALYECNNDDNCGDESDEQNCACRIEEHRCPDGRCIQQSWVCDGDEDCEDGSDEKDCNTCADHQFRCADYECVNADLRCEGTKNCADNSDETGCVTIGVVSGQNDILKAFDGEEMVPVCAEGILQVWLPQLCKALGQGAPLAFASIIADSGEHFMTIVDGASDVFSMYDLEYTNQCPGDSVLRLSCRASICGQSATVPLEGPAPFIIGGDLASSGQWPWALALMYRGQYRCSAVLIDNGWAMTAAHCFFWSNGYTLEFLPHYFTLRAGTNSLITDDEHTRSFKVRRIVLHPTYTVSTNGFRYQDVALIQLETEVEFTDYIRPACMPESEQTFPRTSTCYITGWGYTKTAAIKPADQLREAKMNLWSEERCKGPRGWGDLIQPATQTCAGYDNGYITTCFGDSGGGLVCRDFSNRWVLYGITSLGPTGCDLATNSGGILTRPGVYATVPAYVDWVGGVLAQYR
ncbi:hypothetical protein CAPTEDRAFT_176051 [Capitella teleta]|uniref:Peptidase S1 domain-containing protein n=1 Tax=Capitella teleta TaxID=283909 RepID=R7TB33_CAPTE|nr:hypothetical protein CAPTEDRAFT_176051 [Capitella teleta]|eukprot:ELT90938.1 hypothetical protein CAPTEDRAFT_176051 [Capitella teleta]